MIYGLALGSGGIRGIAHTAFIDVLLKKRNNIKFEVVTGCSAGSVVGAMYALNPELNIKNKLKTVIKNNEKNIKMLGKELDSKLTLLSKMISSRSITDNNFAYNMFKEFYGKKKFSDCKVKLGIIAFDLNSGNSEYITEGYIIDAVMASSNVPGAFEPMRLGSMELVDGAVLHEVPVFLNKNMGADYVIANHVSPLIIYEEYDNGMDYLHKIDEYKIELITQHELKQANEVYYYNGKHFWYDFFDYDTIYKNSKKIYMRDVR